MPKKQEVEELSDTFASAGFSSASWGQVCSSVLFRQHLALGGDNRREAAALELMVCVPGFRSIFTACLFVQGVKGSTSDASTTELPENKALLSSCIPPPREVELL